MTSFTRATLQVVLAAAAVTSCGKQTDARAPSIGTPAPAYSALDLDGKPVALAALKGHVVVLNVWATWCLPCREETPQLDALHRQYAAQGVEVIGVSIDAAGMGLDVRDFARDHGMSYPVWLDPDNQFALKFSTVGVPETFVIDRTGTIRWRMKGAVRSGDSTLAVAVRSALGS